MPAVAAKLKGLAPYAAIGLALPGGSVIALLLWLCRRQGWTGALGKRLAAAWATISLQLFSSCRVLPLEDTGERYEHPSDSR
jgi:hypothetical protein